MCQWLLAPHHSLSGDKHLTRFHRSIIMEYNDIEQCENNYIKISSLYIFN